MIPRKFPCNRDNLKLYLYFVCVSVCVAVVCLCMLKLYTFKPKDPSIVLFPIKFPLLIANILWINTFILLMNYKSDIHLTGGCNNN